MTLCVCVVIDDMENLLHLCIYINVSYLPRPFLFTSRSMFLLYVGKFVACAAQCIEYTKTWVCITICLVVHDVIIAIGEVIGLRLSSSDRKKVSQIISEEFRHFTPPVHDDLYK